MFRRLRIRSLSNYHINDSSIRRNLSSKAKPFDKILIANRGEIACRIIRTARKLGVKTVAVYSDVDARAMHVQMADEAVFIGGSASKDSYLQMQRVLDAAIKTGAQGIHPGYGFLSENAKFVDMVEKAGIAFIGPPSSSMDAMGDKINSKKIAKDAGCYVIPGFEGEVESEDKAVSLAKDIGYPVMIKASAGGGGKGMRVAYDADQLREGFRLSKAEALSSFGDDRMLIERFIEDPHHIEIQVIADSMGNVAAFPERECSVQRRNQKVVEESPSCLLTPETRRLMQQQAIALCKATGYRSAGTVEMLCDGKQNFYFLEMNTRLQVEHPITEQVSGEDLVEHMLWVASGKPLPQRLISNPFIEPKGWAIESRVYAEDPHRGFLPSIGPLITYREPPVYVTETETVRCDSGVYEGGSISMYYDPMISKLVTYAQDRKTSIKLMEKALDQYVISGLGNNLTFCRDVMKNEKFKTGDYNTKFIPEQYPNGFHGVTLNPQETKELIAAAAAIHVKRSSDADSNSDEMVVILGGPKGKAYLVTSFSQDGITLNIKPYEDSSNDKPGEKIKFHGFDWVDGEPIGKISFQRENEMVSEFIQYEGRGTEGYKLRYLGSQQEVIVRTRREHELSIYMLPPVVKDFSKFLLCPMPGTLISCSVKPGQRVEAGQQLAVIEAMKMQNILRAEKSAVVKSVSCTPGSHLKVDQAIVEFE